MIIFKSGRLKKEFNSPDLDRRVRMLIFMLSGYVEYTYGMRLKITSVYRSDAEQMEIYGGKMPSYGNIHGQWRAIDFVIEKQDGTNMKHDDCIKLASDFNHNYIQHDNQDRYPTLVFHSIQKGDIGHFHCQVSYKNQTRLRRPG